MQHAACSQAACFLISASSPAGHGAFARVLGCTWAMLYLAEAARLAGSCLLSYALLCWASNNAALHYLASRQPVASGLRLHSCTLLLAQY